MQKSLFPHSHVAGRDFRGHVTKSVQVEMVRSDWMEEETKCFIDKKSKRKKNHSWRWNIEMQIDIRFYFVPASSSEWSFTGRHFLTITPEIQWKHIVSVLCQILILCNWKKKSHCHFVKRNGWRSIYNRLYAKLFSISKSEPALTGCSLTSHLRGRCSGDAAELRQSFPRSWLRLRVSTCSRGRAAAHWVIHLPSSLPPPSDCRTVGVPEELMDPLPGLLSVSHQASLTHYWPGPGPGDHLDRRRRTCLLVLQ